MITRRGFLGGLLAAPAIVRASSLDGLHLIRSPRPAPLFAAQVIEIVSNGSSWILKIPDP